MTDPRRDHPLEPADTQPVEPDPDRVRPTDGPDDESQRAGGSVSEAGSSFSDPETTAGGADAAPGTPDGVPEGNRESDEHADRARRDDLRS